MAMLFRLVGHKHQIKCIDVSFDKLWIVSGDESGEIILWNLETRRSVRTMKVHSATILTLKFVSSSLIMSHGRDNKLKIFKFDDFDQVYEQDVNALNFCNAAVVPYSWPLKLAVPATVSSEYIDIYEISSDFELKRLHARVGEGKDGSVMTLMFSTDGGLYAGFESGRVMKFGDGKELGTLKVSKKPVLSLYEHFDRLYVGSANKRVNVYKLTDSGSDGQQSELKLERTIDLPARGSQTLAMSENGQLYVQSWSGDVFPQMMKVGAKCILVNKFPELNQLRRLTGEYVCVGGTSLTFYKAGEQGTMGFDT